MMFFEACALCSPMTIREVGLGKSLDAIVLPLDADLHPLKLEVLAYPFGDFGSRSVIPEEREAQIQG